MGRQLQRFINEDSRGFWLWVIRISTKWLKEAIEHLSVGRQKVTKEAKTLRGALLLLGTWPKAARILKVDTGHTEAIDRIY